MRSGGRGEKRRLSDYPDLIDNSELHEVVFFRNSISGTWPITSVNNNSGENFIKK
jgi:hypothetical protein